MVRTELVEAEWVLANWPGTKAVAGLSERIWKITSGGELVMVAGVYRMSLLGAAEIWLVPTEWFKGMRLVRACFPLMRQVAAMYPKLIAHAQVGQERHDKFLRFLGFVPTERVDVDAEGLEHRRYELCQPLLF